MYWKRYYFMKRKLFFIVGAQRAGTTYLLHMMDQHPQINMAKPFIPEPKFFLNEDEIQKGEDYYFKKHFVTKETATVFGEKSTSYLEVPEAGRKLKAMFPDAKIIITLRNPVFRAVSNYFYSKNNGLEFRSIQDSLMNNAVLESYFTTSVSPFKYIQRGEYVKYLKNYFSIFDKNNVKVLIFTRVAGNPEEIRKIYSFVGADGDYVPHHYFDKINTNDVVYNIPKEVTDYLKEYYQPHVEELENFLGMKIPEWKNFDRFRQSNPVYGL